MMNPAEHHTRPTRKGGNVTPAAPANVYQPPPQAGMGEPEGGEARVERLVRPYLATDPGNPRLFARVPTGLWHGPDAHRGKEVQEALAAYRVATWGPGPVLRQQSRDRAFILYFR